MNADTYEIVKAQAVSLVKDGTLDTLDKILDRFMAKVIEYCAYQFHENPNRRIEPATVSTWSKGLTNDNGNR